MGGDRGMQAEKLLEIKEVIRRSYNVKSFRLAAPEWIDFSAGQFLMVALGDDPGLKRYLSISSSPTEKGYLEFTKKITQSGFSSVLDRLKPGDSVKVRYPFGSFTLQDSPHKIAFLSGGIGITPVRSMCKYAVDKNIGKDIVLIYANRSMRDIVFADDFSALSAAYPLLRLVHVLCEAEPGFKCSTGQIDAGLIRKEVPDYMDRRFYLCGPPQMVAAMRAILEKELGLDKGLIVTENFQGY
ncbi:MAG: FAD-binding oxidoreductase [Candidatus Omnitrophota bacterium]